MQNTEQVPFEHSNIYAVMAEKEYSTWVYTERRAVVQKGNWRQSAFNSDVHRPLDLEIGVGNGFFFAHLCKSIPDRLVLGIELKFKPLIQTIKRAIRTGASNMRVIRYDASNIAEIFAPS